MKYFALLLTLFFTFATHATGIDYSMINEPIDTVEGFFDTSCVEETLADQGITKKTCNLFYIDGDPKYAPLILHLATIVSFDNNNSSIITVDNHDMLQYNKYISPLKIDIHVDSSTGGSVEIISIKDPVSQANVKVYSTYNIHLSDDIAKNMDYADLKFSINNEMLPSDSGKLTVAYFNEITKKWEPVGDVHIDLDSMTVTARVTHFSTYAIVEMNSSTAIHNIAKKVNNQFNITNVNNELRLNLSHNEQIKIDLFNLNGSHVTTLYNGLLKTGLNRIGLNNGANLLSSGSYIARVKAGKIIHSYQFLIQ